MSRGTSCHFGHFLQVSKKSLWSLILYNFFHDFIHLYSPGQGQTAHKGPSFDVNRNRLSLRSFATSFKQISMKSAFIQLFFMVLYMYIAPGQGLTTSWGWNFDVNRNILSLRSFVASFKKMSLKSYFIQFFHDLIHIYSPGAGADSPQGTNFRCQQKGLIALPICCNFQRNLFEVWFYTIFFILYMYTALGQGAYRLQGTKFWCQ